MFWANVKEVVRQGMGLPLDVVYSPGSPGHAGLPGRVPAGSGSGQRFETRGIPGSPG